jgi:hypothetical protein
VLGSSRVGKNPRSTVAVGVTCFVVGGFVSTGVVFGAMVFVPVFVLVLVLVFGSTGGTADCPDADSTGVTVGVAAVSTGAKTGPLAVGAGAGATSPLAATVAERTSPRATTTPSSAALPTRAPAASSPRGRSASTRMPAASAPTAATTASPVRRRARAAEAACERS